MFVTLVCCDLISNFDYLCSVKANGSHRRQINKTPSRDATPLADGLDVTSLEGAPKYRRSTFVDDVCSLRQRGLRYLTRILSRSVSEMGMNA